MIIRMLSTDDKLAEIKHLYYRTTRQTIQQDLEKALDLLKSMPTEEDRDRAAVYMDGLAQMRKEWSKGSKPSNPSKPKGRGQPGGSKSPGAASSRPAPPAPTSKKKRR